MPNIKSAKKRVDLTRIFTVRNQMAKSALKTQLKKFDAAVAEGSAEASDAYKAAVKKIDQAVANGIMHKNAAARKKSRLTIKINKAAQ